MAERFALAAKQHVSRRALLCAAIVSLLAGAVASRSLEGAGGGTVAPSTVTAAAGTRGALAKLSPLARASIAAAVAAKEPSYAIHTTAGGLEAQNPAQGLRLSFARSGPRVSAHGVDLGLRLEALDSGSSRRALGGAEPHASGNRVVYAHAGVSEWYVNSTLGLEQGFTLAHAPRAGEAGALTLELRAGGDVTPTLAADGQSVDFSNLSGHGLRYGAVSAVDADGRSLPSTLTLVGHRVLLHIDAARASFPVRIDPLIEQDPEKLLEAVLKERGTSFGRSVAISADGNTVLVGGPGGTSEAGAGWMFTRSGTAWTQQGKKLQIPVAAKDATCSEEVEDPAEEPGECGLGWSVALSADGNTALLGAPNAMEQEGTAWVFNRSMVEGEWSLTQLKLPEPQPKGHYGRSVALSADGDTALIGAPAEGAGRAWAFSRTAEGWSGPPASLAGGERSGDSRFGRSVALSGDGETALVGGPGDNVGTGAAWGFSATPSGWVVDGAKIVGTGASFGAHFGLGLALSADGAMALIGAYGNASDSGAVWSYTQTGGSFVQLGAPLVGPAASGEGEPEEESFGYAVALSPSGNAAVIGAPRAKSGRGATLVYEREGAGWKAVRELVGGVGEEARARFGASVAVSSDAATLVVGGPRQLGSGGAAWVFSRGPSVEVVSPNVGPSGGGTVVTIKGEHLAGATAVRFGSSEAESFTVESEKSISAVAPPGANVVDVTVETQFGVSVTNKFDHFSYKVSSGTKGGAVPGVQHISPEEGPATGGTTVTITGEHLGGASGVMFGSNPASSVTLGNEKSLTAVSPPGAGTVDVTVVGQSGTSATRPADEFTYTGEDGSSTGGATNDILASGPTGSGPLGLSAVAGCGVALLSKRLAVQPHNRAVLKLGGYGLGRCSGKVRLRVKTRLAHKRFGTKTIGTAVFTVIAGKHLAVRVHLNAVGRRMLAARRGRLNASVLIVRSSPAPRLARTASVRLLTQKSHRAKPTVK
jgi:IPT/TIG domain-containing protein